MDRFPGPLPGEGSPTSTLLRRVALGLAGLVLLLAVAALAALALGLESAPRVGRPEAVSATQAAGLGVNGRDLKTLLRGHVVGGAGSLRSIVLSQHEVELLAEQALRRQLPSATSHVMLQPGAAVVAASLAVPDNPFGRWLNVEAMLRGGEAGLPRVDALRVGRLPLPGWLADAALRHLVARHGERLAGAEADAAGRLMVGMIRQVEFGPGSVRVAYEWPAGARDRLVAALVPLPLQERARAYQQRLAMLAETAVGPSGSVSLAALLPPMFELAAQRSAAGGGAAQENLAAVLTLALYTTGRSWSAFVPAARDWPQPRPVVVTLYGREDFPQHWLVSAAIALEGGGPLADAVGIYKEVADMQRGGSGFSFNDLAADRAGRRYGLLAAQAPALLQDRLAAGVKEADLMPDAADLPEFMPAEEFRRRYGAVGSPEYSACWR